MARKLIGLALVAALTVTALPVAAQNFSDAYNFLKAVRAREGGKVQEMVATPGSIVINSKDRATGETALHIVVRDRDLGWLSYLAGKGARIDAQANDGTTPLLAAAQIGWAEGVDLLLSRRAGVDIPNRAGETPLSFAVRSRDMNSVRLLLAKGANPKRADNGGLSPIDYARRDGSRSAALLKLLETPVAPVKPAQGPKL